MASQWNSVLIWALVFKCMVMVQYATTQSDLGDRFMNFQCEMLPAEICAFAVGAGGFRCVLETAFHVDGSITYKCQTLRLVMQIGSDINSSARRPHIETDECLSACGLHRLTVGIDSARDKLFDDSFREKLCSPTCKQKCANIIDHFDTIMAEQGEDLNSMCDYVTEYLNSERERQQQPTSWTRARNGESSRRNRISNKHSQILYEQSQGPSSDRGAWAPGPKDQ